MNKFFLLLVLFVLQASILLDKPQGVAAQEPAFELPVELIGFPVIIVAVRLSNFVKKLAYSLNPKTYVGGHRARRSIDADSDEMINMLEAEKRLVSELGENVCIYPKVCLHHAEQARKTGRQELVVDWDEIFRYDFVGPGIPRKSISWLTEALIQNQHPTKLRWQRITWHLRKIHVIYYEFIRIVLMHPEINKPVIKPGYAIKKYEYIYEGYQNFLLNAYHYKNSKEKQKEYYLLSVFLGDFIASPRFCNQLVKRGRICEE